MNAVNQMHTNPNCTSATYCAQGFSTNIFINYGDNTRLDAPGFSIFGVLDSASLATSKSLFSAYGEVKDLCPLGATDPYCVGTGNASQGVDVERLLSEGDMYLKSEKPKLDSVKGVRVSEVSSPVESVS